MAAWILLSVSAATLAASAALSVALLLSLAYLSYSLARRAFF